MNLVSVDDTPENLVAYIAQPVYSIRAWLGLLAVLCFLASVAYSLFALPAAADTPHPSRDSLGRRIRCGLRSPFRNWCKGHSEGR